jgi:hypothetical protein
MPLSPKMLISVGVNIVKMRFFALDIFNQKSVMHDSWPLFELSVVRHTSKLFSSITGLSNQAPHIYICISYIHMIFFKRKMLYCLILVIKEQTITNLFGWVLKV